MDANLFLDASYTAWVLTGTAIGWFFWPVIWRDLRALWRREIKCLPNTTWTAFAIFLGWFFGAILYRGFWKVWHASGRYESFLDPLSQSWLMPALAWGVILAGCLHIRVATVTRFGERAWLTWLGLMLVVVFIEYAVRSLI